MNDEWVSFIYNNNFFSLYLQSLIRTAEQLKIKGLSEISDHHEDIDAEIAYPPHKKSRASRKYDSHHNRSLPLHIERHNKESSIHLTAKNVLLDSKSPTKESRSNKSSDNSNKAMASLDMGMNMVRFL